MVDRDVTGINRKLHHRKWRHQLPANIQVSRQNSNFPANFFELIATIQIDQWDDRIQYPEQQQQPYTLTSEQQQQPYTFIPEQQQQPPPPPLWPLCCPCGAHALYFKVKFFVSAELIHGVAYLLYFNVKSSCFYMYVLSFWPLCCLFFWLPHLVSSNSSLYNRHDKFSR